MLVIGPGVPWMECGLIRYKLLHITCWSVFNSLFPLCRVCPKTCELFNNAMLQWCVYKVSKLWRINASANVLHVKDKLRKCCSKCIFLVYKAILVKGITGWYIDILVLTIKYKDFENNNKCQMQSWHLASFSEFVFHHVQIVGIHGPCISVETNKYVGSLTRNETNWSQLIGPFYSGIIT